MKLTRRELVESCIGRGLLLSAVPMSSSNLFALWQEAQGQETQTRKPTPTEVLGPFFKKGAPNVAQLRAPGDPGFPLRVTGKVVNIAGEPVNGARVDIWHADQAGRYDLKGYRYRSRLLPASSVYTVETVMPGHYDDRPAQHIHYMISAPGYRTLVTQAYFATDPWFEGDPDANFRKRGIVKNRDLVRPVTLIEKGSAASAAITFDICLEKA